MSSRGLEAATALTPKNSDPFHRGIGVFMHPTNSSSKEE
ncbi:MAG: hypothetical protein QOG21_3 [Actinomycetota bacterium]|nr:hypothetical protein [Actinomycetota bacterium]